jgi:prevent-host-death family protein
MAEVTIRELRNNGGEVVDRAAQGEPITITRAGQPVAQLTAVRAPLSGAVLLERWKRLPAVDPVALKADVDEVVDASLFPAD